jgi:hypothetical protein
VPRDLPPIYGSSLTDLVRTLQIWHRQLTSEIPVSIFSGTNPNASAITGVPGNLVTNLQSSSDSFRLWGKSGSTVVSSTTGWVQFGASGSGSISVAVKTANQGFSSVAAADVTDLSFAVTAGGQYHYRFVTAHQHSLETQGIGFAVNGPASNTIHAYRVSIPFAAGGTDAAFESWGNANNDLLVASGAPSASSNYIGVIEGIIVPTNSGTLQLRAANEVATSLVTIKAGSCGFLTTLS